MTPEKLKQRRCDRIKRAREKAAAEATAKWITENFSHRTLMPMELSPLMMLTAVFGGIALAGVIIALIENGVI